MRRITHARRSKQATLAITTLLLAHGLAQANTFPAAFNLGKLDGKIGFRLNGVAENDGSGITVSAAGDINHDGIDDLVLGAPGADPSGSNSGSSYVVFGSATGFPDAVDLAALGDDSGFRLDGVALNDRSAETVRPAGDINDDGIDDLLVSGERTDFNGQNSGSAYVVFGHAGAFTSPFKLASLNGANGFRLDGAVALDHTGSDLGGVGDVNGDGVDDVVVAAEFAEFSGAEAGSVYVVFGHAAPFAASMNLSALDGTDGFRIDGVAPLDSAGYSVSGAGDINHDGLNDILIGATSADPHGGNSGSVYVVFGRETPFPAAMNLSVLDGSNGFRLDGELAGDNLGTSVSRAGDVNADGVDDVIIGASESSPTANRAGCAYVVFGDTESFPASIAVTSLKGGTGYRISGAAAGHQVGESVSHAGDVNHDGIADMIVSAHGATFNGPGSGSAYVVFGRNGNDVIDVVLSGLDGRDGFRVDGATTSEFAGLAVSGAGDINDDGIDDVLVGAPDARANGNAIAGVTYVVFGRDSQRIFDDGFE